MAGRGPAPKDASKRARKDPRNQQVINIEPSAQPTLPVFRIKGEEIPWPVETLAWWTMWGESPISDGYTDIDWAELAITASFHARTWYGSMEAAKEYRLRAAKFGATPQDRASLRITFASANAAESKPNAAAKPRAKHGVLMAMPKAAGE